MSSSIAEPSTGDPELAPRSKRADELADREIAKREERYPNGINYYVMGWIVILHIGALAAPFFFSWQGLVVAFVMHWITGGIGICLGYHRMFTHSSFRTSKPIEWAIGVIGGLAGEGCLINWVADHRKHHAHSDQEEDPHSPREGLGWSHILWLAYKYTPEALEAHHRRWAPDLMKDRVLMAISNLFLPLQIACGLITFGLGYWLGGGWYMGLSLLTWGVFVRMVVLMHCTWFVNSASHAWGYINYKTTDDSKNNWWVALITYGEGWHNNHHAYPRMANHGHRWWEFDATFNAIRLMKVCGLVWDVVDYKKKSDLNTSAQPVAEEAAIDKLEWNSGELESPADDKASQAL